MAKDPKRVAAGKKSKRKGSSFELKTSKEFTKWWGKGEFCRSPGSGGWGRPQHKAGFNAQGDIITTNRDFPWCIECKNQEGWTLDQLLLNPGCIIWSWWAQTVDETPEDLRPMLIFKKNFQRPMVMVGIDDDVLYPTMEYFNDGTEEETPRIANTTMSFMHKNGNVVVFPLAELYAGDPDTVGRKEDD